MRVSSPSLPPTARSGLPALPTRDWSGSRHVTAAWPIRFSPRFHPSVAGLAGTQEPGRRGAPQSSPSGGRGVTAWKTGGHSSNYLDSSSMRVSQALLQALRTWLIFGTTLKGIIVAI